MLRRFVSNLPLCREPPQPRDPPPQQAPLVGTGRDPTGTDEHTGQ